MSMLTNHAFDSLVQFMIVSLPLTALIAIGSFFVKIRRVPHSRTEMQNIFADTATSALWMKWIRATKIVVFLLLVFWAVVIIFLSQKGR